MTTDEEAETYERKRSEHLEWCKNRAYRYWREGKLEDAVVSMYSDLQKHPGTRHGIAGTAYLLVLGGMYANDGDSDAVRRWIEGFR